VAERSGPARRSAGTAGPHQQHREEHTPLCGEPETLPGVRKGAQHKPVSLRLAALRGFSSR